MAPCIDLNGHQFIVTKWQYNKEKTMRRATAFKCNKCMQDYFGNYGSTLETLKSSVKVETAA